MRPARGGCRDGQIDGVGHGHQPVDGDCHPLGPAVLIRVSDHSLTELGAGAVGGLPGDGTGDVLARPPHGPRLSQQKGLPAIG